MSHDVQPQWTTLIDARALAAQLGNHDLRVFDCRFALNDPAAGETAWRAGHIHGAQYAHLDRDLSGPHRAGAGRHPWPDAGTVCDWLGRNGVTPDTQVVAYDGGDGAYAARLWWLLRTLGHRKVAVLDGGWAHWTAQGLPTDNAIPVAQPAMYRAASSAGCVLDAVEIPARLAAGDLLIDARAAERFRGEVEPIDRIAGHVPGAVNRPYALNLSDGRFKSAAQLAEEFTILLDGRVPQRTIAMCGSGVTACHHLLAMAHAGMPGARLFTGSWSGWIEDPMRPVSIGSD